MALTTCPECGHEVPNEAASCANCGHLIAPETSVPATPAVAAPETPGSDRSWPTAMLVGAAAVMVGSFLPWATVSFFLGTTNVAGTDGDGVLTLFIGAVLAFVAFRAINPGIGRGASILAVIAALILFGIALYDFIDIRRVASDLADISDDVAQASVGIGLWIVLVGSGAAAAGSIGLLRKQ